MRCLWAIRMVSAMEAAAAPAQQHRDAGDVGGSSSLVPPPLGPGTVRLEISDFA